MAFGEDGNLVTPSYRGHVHRADLARGTGSSVDLSRLSVHAQAVCASVPVRWRVGAGAATDGRGAQRLGSSGAADGRHLRDCSRAPRPKLRKRLSVWPLPQRVDHVARIAAVTAHATSAGRLSLKLWHCNSSNAVRCSTTMCAPPCRTEASTKKSSLRGI